MPIPRKPLTVPAAMCEAYHYPNPSAFSRGMEIPLPGARLILVSGTASVGPAGETLHPGDLPAQARRAFDNVAAVLSSAGATWRDAVKVTVYLRDIDRDYEAFNIARLAFFREAGVDPFPASTCIEARLCRADLLVEMEVMAIVEGGVA